MKRKVITIVLDEGDEVVEKEVKKFGGKAGHIIVPEKHIGKKAFVVLTDKIEEDSNKK
ncbi:MAG: DUF2080 family transposase-associated protein [Nanoarchaeota archaeon]|nr:DUF2080 family transposase-associated protein [Nanoarchaeota archaeon]MBU1027975.1 DUF2080 family transposase-associated protein [Nanoarchaeota archaeon]